MSLISLLRRFLPTAPAPLAGQVAQMRERSLQCLGPHGLHRISYVEWGDPESTKVLLCVHGLTRNGRDFDFLARSMAQQGYRVVCPDVVGRGRSDWLKVADGYGFPQYTADMVSLIARLDVEQVDWVGTSMGGLIGMMLASQHHTPVRRLVLNDVGPLLTADALRRIGEYVGQAPSFASVEDAEKYVRQVSAPFGPLTDEQWRHLTVHALRTRDDGKLELSYDPAIGLPFRSTFLFSDIDLWTVYDAIHCPTLVLRGEHSDLLSRETLGEMARRGPRARTLEIPGVGHAPMLMDAAQIAPVREFLLQS